jgi:general secretion pathway protein K
MSRRGGRGYALVAALWLLVALGAVGLELSLETHRRALAAANSLERSRATAAAEAGLETVHERLAESLQRAGPMAALDPDPWARPDMLFRDSLGFGASGAVVRLADANAALNLNQAGQEALLNLLAGLRVDFGRADRLSQAIADWRDADDLRRGRGAEREDYLRHGALVLPRNAPFQRVGEIRHVLGMTPEIFRAVEPYLTTAGTGQVNFNAAPPVILGSLRGMSGRAVAAVVRRRSSGTPVRSLEELALELPAGPREAFQAAYPALLPIATFDTRELLATSTAWSEGSPVRVRAEGLFARSGEHVFLTWRRVE